VGRARTRTGALLLAAVLPLAACQGDDEATAGPDPTPSATGSAASSFPAGSTAPSTTPPAASAAASSEAPTSAAPASAEGQVEAALAGMSRERQIAQLFVVGVPLDDVHQGDDLAARAPGGIFLAGRSQLPADDLAGITAAWQEAAGPTGLWIAVDQEGGNVQTLSGPGFAELPTAVEQGRLPEGELEALAGDLGASLDRAGINLNLAPVADVVPAGTEEGNEPIGAFGREYGSSAAEVAHAAEVVVDGLAAHRVTAVLKHFPGLGRVQGNTDTREEVVDPDTTPDDASVQVFAELAEAADAPPFVMTSSAVYPGIDGSEPAGWSAEVIDGLLRGRLGFDGVVISDDVGNAAAVQDVAPGERAVRCLAAGGTLVLTVNPELYAEMLAAVVDRDRTDEDFRARVDAAVRTALLAKAEAGLLAP
jgi:beta-glucosidase-like glycosyl hydrolase